MTSKGCSCTARDSSQQKVKKGFWGPRCFRHISSRSQGPRPVQHGGWVGCPTGRFYVGKRVFVSALLQSCCNDEPGKDHALCK